MYLLYIYLYIYIILLKIIGGGGTLDSRILLFCKIVYYIKRCSDSPYHLIFNHINPSCMKVFGIAPSTKGGWANPPSPPNDLENGRLYNLWQAIRTFYER